MTPRCLGLLIALCPVAPAYSAAFCVGTASELSAALVTAATNNQDDGIRIRLGTYPIVNGNRFEVVVENGRSLDISGGWVSSGGNCNLMLGQPEDTVLTAQQLAGEQVLRIGSANGVVGSVNLRNLSMIDGRGLGANAGCTNVDTSFGSVTILLDRLVFSGCRNGQTISAGALAVSHLGTGDIIVRNSIFASNLSASGPAIKVYVDGTAGQSIVRFHNNTVVGNAPVGTAIVPAGMHAISVDGHVEIYNNAIVGNGLAIQPDLFVDGSASVIRDNVYSKALASAGNPQVGGTQPVISSWQTLFASYPSDLRPSPSSQLRDEGSDLNVSFSGPNDHAGTARLQGPRIDAGAFEFEMLFGNGFE